MYTLTTNQKQNLPDIIINEELGPAIDFDKFSVTMLCFLENVPALETIPRSTANRFAHQLWRKYHEQQNCCVDVKEARHLYCIAGR